jgi:hypothetical protein
LASRLVFQTATDVGVIATGCAVFPEIPYNNNIGLQVTADNAAKTENRSEDARVERQLRGTRALQWQNHPEFWQLVGLLERDHWGTEHFQNGVSVQRAGVTVLNTGNGMVHPMYRV